MPIVGHNTIGTTTASSSTTNAFGAKGAIATDHTSGSIWAYLGSDDGTQQAKACLRDVDTGAFLEASAAVTIPVGPGWVEFPLSGTTHTASNGVSMFIYADSDAVSDLVYQYYTPWVSGSEQIGKMHAYSDEPRLFNNPADTITGYTDNKHTWSIYYDYTAPVAPMEPDDTALEISTPESTLEATGLLSPNDTSLQIQTLGTSLYDPNLLNPLSTALQITTPSVTLETSPAISPSNTELSIETKVANITGSTSLGVGLQPGDIVITLSGGTSNSDFSTSLGGTPSNVEVPENIAEWFNPINTSDTIPGSTKYRCVYIKNTSTINVESFLTYILNNVKGDVSFEFGLGGINSTGTNIPDETTTPSGIVFSDQPGSSNGVLLEDLGQNEVIQLWVKRVVAPSAVDFTDNNAYIAVEAFDQAASDQLVVDANFRWPQYVSQAITNYLGGTDWQTGGTGSVTQEQVDPLIADYNVRNNITSGGGGGGGSTGPQLIVDIGDVIGGDAWAQAVEDPSYDYQILGLSQYGQSNAGGVYTSESGGVLTSNPYGDRVITLNSGLTSNTNGASFVNAAEGTVSFNEEVGLLAAGNYIYEVLTKRGLEDRQVFVTLTFQGATAISNLSKGTSTYLNWYNSLVDAKTAATAQGKSIAINWIAYNQGEADGLLYATYRDKLVTLYDDMVADVKAVTGQSHDPIMLLPLVMSTSRANATNQSPENDIGIAQQEAAKLRNGKIIPVCHTGVIPHHQQGSDFYHYSNVGQRKWGHYNGKFAMFKELRPLRAISATISGSSVILGLTGGIGDLKFNYEFAPNTTSKGFVVMNDGIEQTITSVTLSGPREVTIQCNSPLTGTTVEVSGFYYDRYGFGGGTLNTDIIPISDSDIRNSNGNDGPVENIENYLEPFLMNATNY